MRSHVQVKKDLNVNANYACFPHLVSFCVASPKSSKERNCLERTFVREKVTFSVAKSGNDQGRHRSDPRGISLYFMPCLRMASQVRFGKTMRVVSRCVGSI